MQELERFIGAAAGVLMLCLAPAPVAHAQTGSAASGATTPAGTPATTGTAQRPTTGTAMPGTGPDAVPTAYPSGTGAPTTAAGSPSTAGIGRTDSAGGTDSANGTVGGAAAPASSNQNGTDAQTAGRGHSWGWLGLLGLFGLFGLRRNVANPTVETRANYEQPGVTTRP